VNELFPFARISPGEFFCPALRIAEQESLMSIMEADMQDLQALLEISSREHDHLCPRQILGVRMGLAGTAALGLEPQPAGKRMLVIAETDGCFVDGVIAATGCTAGHRTLRIDDYGKVAATFVEVETGRAIRLAPHLDVRQRAAMCLPDIPRRYLAQMQAYQILLETELFSFAPVFLKTPVEKILSRPGVRVTCAVCGEEIINERDVHRDGLTLCQACANGAYYRSEVDSYSAPVIAGAQAVR
jgi:formylmethanofuran dehydrogenase subunit E